MATPTPTEIEKALADIETIVVTERQAFANSKARIQASRNNLAAIPTQYADVIAEIDSFVPTGAFETLAKDKRAKYAAEFTALRNEINALIASF